MYGATSTARRKFSNPSAARSQVIKVITGVFLTETMKVASMDDSTKTAKRNLHASSCLGHGGPSP